MEEPHIMTIPSKEIEVGFVPNISQTVVMNIKNLLPSRLAYKIMTTAPLLYLVYPNQGIIPPDTMIDINIQVKLGATMPETSHKFLFKTVPIDNTVEDVAEAWETADPS